MKFWQRIIVNALVFLALSGLLQANFYVGSVWVALGASIVLALLNMTLKPILFILSLPITIISLGLFSIVINAVMLSLTAAIMGNGFYFSSFWTTMLVALIVSLVNTFFNNRTTVNIYRD
ncbi:phage holin family protein [Desemzia sp. FAM 23989]|uniref:phage holin family protein n=1 Tax=Desemzia sp. FAM 23989 TaxID=3259523 RepID=UPI0038837A2D